MKQFGNDVFTCSKRRRRKINFNFILFITCLLIITSGASLFLGNYIATKGVFLVKTSDEVVSTAKQINDGSKYAALFTVRDTLMEKFDGEINDDVLLDGAIKGMTNALNDPYTVFMNENEFNSFMKQSSGSITGIGVEVISKDNKIVIKSPIKDSPAEKAGLKENDVIEKINDVELSGNDTQKLIAMIADSKDSEVKLTIKREEAESFDVNLKPEQVKINSVRGEMLDSSVGYIRIKTFMNENTSKDFQDEIQSLKDQGMKGMILDLRDNPGGLLSEGVGVASQFIPDGKIVTYTVDKYGNKNESVSTGGIAQDIPLVILVNGDSASASEVVTGALRDYGIATVIGETTFGKGIVQQSIKFNDGIGGLKVTISKYYTPNGENIHKKGITPDIQVTTPVKLDENGYDKNGDEQLKSAIEQIQQKIQ
ncbi:S41 family peptidase [Clostridium saccharobutylicum]|uniref:Carboxy-terminal processing protease CtpA n=1 Tax=Clostridium saccharobutylicum DSM 13864 TaxID=1345695 RepID=U5N0E7_CLOSA|nr:carboxy-terminal processing protease CtpA [Clostridium saccharobutylicum DSM 13864]AQR92542.1 carboxy-terminal processing protease CtpA precursor [Clostridium saccharobutylicum]AQS02445.1 carboxy-terminal processing protease CtpA precursor [Clostridium saccharobutylicum]AQS12048.1 carboxy-terminal processing protease CtpA precursor [Clostridium saccharobutylicum]AQS16428.1 carboxy-terminal processing protease CtpA precursor [Clostridium saccharobutylicum]